MSTSSSENSLNNLGKALYAITGATIPAYRFRSYMQSGNDEAQYLRYGDMVTIKYTGGQSVLGSFLLYNTTTKLFSTIYNPPLSQDGFSVETPSNEYVVMYFVPRRGVFYENTLLSRPPRMPCITLGFYSSSGLFLGNGTDYAVISPWSGNVKATNTGISACCSSSCAAGSFSSDFKEIIGTGTSTGGGFCMSTVRRKATVTEWASSVARFSGGTLSFSASTRGISGGVSFWINLTSAATLFTFGTAAQGLTLTAVSASQSNTYFLGASLPGSSVSYCSQLLMYGRWVHVTFLYDVWTHNTAATSVTFVINGVESETAGFANPPNFSWEKSPISVTAGPLSGEMSNLIMWKTVPNIGMLRQMFQYNDSTYYAAFQYGLYYFFLNSNTKSTIISGSGLLSVTPATSNITFVKSSISRNFYMKNPLQAQEYTSLGRLLKSKQWESLIMRKKGTAFASAPCTEIGEPCISGVPPTPICQTCSTGPRPRIFEKCPDSTGMFCQDGNRVPLSSCNSENGAVQVSYVGGDICISSSAPTRVEYEFSLSTDTFYNLWIKISGSVASENVYCYLYSGKAISQGLSAAWDVAWTQPPPVTVNKQTENGLSNISTEYNNAAYWLQLGTSNAGFVKCAQAGVYRLVISANAYEGTFRGGLGGAASVATYNSICKPQTPASAATGGVAELSTVPTREGLPFIYDVVVSAREEAKTYSNIDPVKQLYLKAAEYATPTYNEMSVKKLSTIQYIYATRQTVLSSAIRQQWAAAVMNAGASQTVSSSSTRTSYTQAAPPRPSRMSLLPPGTVAGGTTTTTSNAAACVDECESAPACAAVAVSRVLENQQQVLKCTKFTTPVGTQPCSGMCNTPIVLAKSVDGQFAKGSGAATQTCAGVAATRSSGTSPPSNTATWSSPSGTVSVNVITTPSSLYTGLPSKSYTDSGVFLGRYNVNNVSAADKCDSINGCTYFKCYESDWTPYMGFYKKDNWNLSVTSPSIKGEKIPLGEAIVACSKNSMCEGFTYNNTSQSVTAMGSISSQGASTGSTSFIKAPTPAAPYCELYGGYTELNNNPSCNCVSGCSYVGHTQTCPLASGAVCNGQSGTRLCNQTTYQRGGYLNTQFSTIGGLDGLTVENSTARSNSLRQSCLSLPLSLEYTSVKQSGFPLGSLNDEISSPYSAMHEVAVMFRVAGSHIEVQEYDLEWGTVLTAWTNVTSSEYRPLFQPYTVNQTISAQSFSVTYSPAMVETVCVLHDDNGKDTGSMLLVIDYTVSVSSLLSAIAKLTVNDINSQEMQTFLYNYMNMQIAPTSKPELLQNIKSVSKGISMVVVYDTVLKKIQSFYSTNFLYWGWNSPSSVCITYYSETQPTIALIFNNENDEHIYVDTRLLVDQPLNQYIAYMDGPYNTSGMNSLIQQFPIKSQSDVMVRAQTGSGSITRVGSTYTFNNPGTNLTSGTVFKIISEKNLPFLSWSSTISLVEQAVSPTSLAIDSSNLVAAIPGVQYVWKVMPPNGQFPVLAAQPPPSITYINMAQNYNLVCNLRSQTNEVSTYKSISCPHINMVIKNNTQALGGKFAITGTRGLVTQSLEGRINMSKKASIDKQTDTKIQASVQVRTAALVKLKILQQFTKKSPGLHIFYHMTVNIQYYVAALFVVSAVILIMLTVCKRT